MSDADILKELLLVEALANSLKEQCYKTRKLIEASVSTPANHQKGLSDQELAGVSARRRKNLLRGKS